MDSRAIPLVHDRQVCNNDCHESFSHSPAARSLSAVYRVLRHRLDAWILAKKNSTYSNDENTSKYTSGHDEDTAAEEADQG